MMEDSAFPKINHSGRRIAIKVNPPEAFEEGASVIGDTIRDLLNDLAEKEEATIRHLTSNPGFLAAFGDDFVIEETPIELDTLDRRSLDKFTVRVTQVYRFRRRTEDDPPIPRCDCGHTQTVHDRYGCDWVSYTKRCQCVQYEPTNSSSQEKPTV